MHYGWYMTALTESTYVLLRVVSGALFVVHGAQKIFGLFGGHAVPIASRLGAAGLIEIVCGTLIALGLFTAVAAFIASGEMAFAYFLQHAPRAWLPIQNGGEPAVLFCFIFLYLATQGDGKASFGRR